MNPETAFQIQKNARENVKTFQNYLTDLQNWESEMKRKEAALNGEFEQDLPPVRSKIKKEKPVQVKKKTESRIPSYDYKSWDKFDVDKACEEVDTEDIGPVSLDGKKSQEAKMEKLREEAQYEKERGNNFVKQEKWDEAIACYNRAIELVKDDAIYYANRGLCYLKKESLHQAENDCTKALSLDPTYVKALQRRATARELLGSLRAASQDLNEVIALEPNNIAARKQLQTIKARMGTKGAKSKSSPSSTPTTESKTFTATTQTKMQPKIIELEDEPAPKVAVKEESEVNKLKKLMDKWRNGAEENVTVIKTVKKPPHLRSKRPLKPVPIKEIQLGKTEPDKPPTRLKIIEIEDDLAHGDSNNNDSNKIDETQPDKVESKGEGDKRSPESEKLVIDSLVMEKDANVKDMVPPINSVQFMAEWKRLKGKGDARSDYLSIIDPSKIPAIFSNALESDVLSEVLRILVQHTEKFQQKTITAYLQALCRVKRFSALAMFLTDTDKQLLNKLLSHCKTAEHTSDQELADLRNKYEL